MTWELFEPQEIGAWKKTVAQFEAANPSIKVSWVGWPFATYDQNVTAQAQAGHVNADVVMCPPELASTLIDDYGICIPVGDIAHEVGLVPDASHNQYKLNGKLYALGVLVVAFVLEYDQRILAASGLHSPPTTPTEWLEYTEKLTIPSKHQFGNYNVNTAASGADMWFAVQNFPLGWNGAWAKGSKLTIDSKECIASMEFFVNLVKASGLLGTAETIQQKLWDNDQIAMLYSVALGASTLKAAAPKLYPNLRTAPVPWANKKSISRLHTIQHPEDFVEHPGRTRAGEIHRDAEEPVVHRLHQRLPADPLQQLRQPGPPVRAVHQHAPVEDGLRGIELRR